MMSAATLTTTKLTRTCAGCSAKAEGEALLRVVRVDASTIAVDLNQRMVGRGAYVHPTAQCVQRAIRGGFARSFGENVTVSMPIFANQVVRGAHRKMQGLLLAAHRTRSLLVGADLVERRVSEDHNDLRIVLARDAGSIATSNWIQERVAKGRVMAWSTRHELGRWLGRSEVVVCATTDTRIGAALEGAYGLQITFEALERLEAQSV